MKSIPACPCGYRPVNPRERPDRNVNGYPHVTAADALNGCDNPMPTADAAAAVVAPVMKTRRDRFTLGGRSSRSPRIVCGGGSCEHSLSAASSRPHRSVFGFVGTIPLLRRSPRRRSIHGPLHADIRVLAEPRRGLVQDHQPASNPPQHLHIGEGLECEDPVLLNAKIRYFITGWNDHNHSFIWTNTSDDILKKRIINQLQKRDTRGYVGRSGVPESRTSSRDTVSHVSHTVAVLGNKTTCVRLIEALHSAEIQLRFSCLRSSRSTTQPTLVAR